MTGDVTARTMPTSNGSAPPALAAQVAAVEAARARLGDDLEHLSVEVRAQMGHTVQKTAYKGLATVTAVLAGIVVRKLLITGWRKTRHSDPPANPAAAGTGWPDALAWTAATGVAVGVARLVAERGAAEGWRRMTGALPPGLEEVSA